MSRNELDGPANTTSPTKTSLKPGAVGFLSNLTMGIASAAPGYSAALTIGLLAAVTGMGGQSAAVLLLAFIPLYLTAGAYRALSAEMPDAGTTFAWTARAIGPRSGWMGGWAMIVAYACVLGIGAQLASTYFFLMIGWESAAASLWATVGLGLIIIAIATILCLVGIDISARAQRWLLYVELITLGAFVVVALFHAFAGDPGTVRPSLSWVNPFAIGSWGAVAGGVMLGVFMYWGWETAVACAEESEDSRTGPGRAAMLSVAGLVIMYVLLTVAAQSVKGPGFLAAHSGDVLSASAKVSMGQPWDRALFFSVCTSAMAGSLTTLITTSRTMYSMSRAGAMPSFLQGVHPARRTPWAATLVFAGVATVYFVAMTAVSEDFLGDSVAAIGLLVLFYYALTATACAFYFRDRLRSGLSTAWRYVIAPGLGGLLLFAAFLKAAMDNGKSDAGSLSGIGGVGSPLLIAVGALVLGIVVMTMVRRKDDTFFRQVRHSAAQDGARSGRDASAPSP
jgi:amino acid transporter